MKLSEAFSAERSGGIGNFFAPLKQHHQSRGEVSGPARAVTPATHLIDQQSPYKQFANV